jgi:hypothetical protein
MPAWINITADDLNDYLVAGQMDALRSAALGDGQTDPFERIMQDRCNYVRNRISRRISISATPYAIPPELKTCASILIIEAMSGRLAIAIELTEDQRTMIRRAYSDLEIAATADFPVTLPDDAIAPTVQSGGGVSVVSKSTRQATGATMRGL